MYKTIYYLSLYFHELSGDIHINNTFFLDNPESTSIFTAGLLRQTARNKRNILKVLVFTFTVSTCPLLTVYQQMGEDCP